MCQLAFTRPKPEQRSLAVTTRPVSSSLHTHTHASLHLPFIYSHFTEDALVLCGRSSSYNDRLYESAAVIVMLSVVGGNYGGTFPVYSITVIFLTNGYHKLPEVKVSHYFLEAKRPVFLVPCLCLVKQKRAFLVLQRIDMTKQLDILGLQL